MPNEQPTIWDILGYEAPTETQWMFGDVSNIDPELRGTEVTPEKIAELEALIEQGGIGEGDYWGQYESAEDYMKTVGDKWGMYEKEVTGGGQHNMLNYLADLLLKSEGGIDELTGTLGAGHASFTTRDVEQQFKDFATGLFTGEDFMNLSKDNIYDLVKDEFGYGLNQERNYTLEEGEENPLDMFTRYIESLQEGMKAVPTSESFGLDRKIGDIETSGKRELKSASEGYIPGEILSRYGALQGKAGAKQKGEQLEQAYTEDIYGVQRGMGRDVRSTYEDFEDDWFGGVESWLGYLG